MTAQEKHLRELLALLKEYENTSYFDEATPDFAFNERNRIAHRFNSLKGLPICPLPISNARPATPQQVAEVVENVNTVTIAENHYKEN